MWAGREQARIRVVERMGRDQFAHLVSRPHGGTSALFAAPDS
jgi:hypothetical protein